MSYSASTLILRSLHDVFGETDPARRRAATVSWTSHGTAAAPKPPRHARVERAPQPGYNVARRSDVDEIGMRDCDFERKFVSCGIQDGARAADNAAS
jgi:hypothetical protein